MLSGKRLQNKRALTIAEAANFACVSRGTLHNWMVSGLLPFEELPGPGDGSHKFRLIRRQDLDEFLNRHYHQQKRAVIARTIPKELVLLQDEA